MPQKINLGSTLNVILDSVLVGASRKGAEHILVTEQGLEVHYPSTHVGKKTEGVAVPLPSAIMENIKMRTGLSIENKITVQQKEVKLQIETRTLHLRVTVIPRTLDSLECVLITYIKKE